MPLNYYEKDHVFTDDRRPGDILLSDGIAICYTLHSDDITHGEKPGFTPYADRVCSFKDFGAAVTCARCGDGLVFTVESQRTDVSQFGVVLPFNFMGKKESGGWQNQFLFNSPYVSPDAEIMYFYLTKPNGADLVVAVKGGADGWKMDYSPYSCGHYFLSLKLLSNFDRAYGTPRRPHRLQFSVLPVNGFSDALKKLSEFYDLPFVDYDCNGGKTGERIRIRVYGRCDNLITGEFTIGHSGDNMLLPVSDKRAGAVATVYGFDDLMELYRRSMDSVDWSDLQATDMNLCEHQCWATAMLRFLLRYRAQIPSDRIAYYEKLLHRVLDMITETDESRAIPRLTIWKLPRDNFPAFHMYRSTRVQELFFGITLLLDAYRYFGDKKYLEYAVGAADCLVNFYQKPDGRIERHEWGRKMDYTTVCCPMIPLVDLAKFLENLDKDRSRRYFECAGRMAAYLYSRGFVFPTEGSETEEAEAEMEEGSVSCTALGLLYYCKNVHAEQKYIEKAKEILDLHESWVIRTPLAQMHGSTLRWWETLWEGDADGPALCCGHAWTIWRAEADWLYYSLTGDRCYRAKAWNGFMTNLAKIHPDGKSYSIYNADMINGGGFHDRCEDVKFEIAGKYAKQPDSGLSRYVWIRLNDTFLSEID